MTPSKNDLQKLMPTHLLEIQQICCFFPESQIGALAAATNFVTANVFFVNMIASTDSGCWDLFGGSALILEFLGVCSQGRHTGMDKRSGLKLEEKALEKQLRGAEIVAATSIARPRADIAYYIHGLSRRLSKTRNWIVALKTLVVVHRLLREEDPTFQEELLNFTQRGRILRGARQVSRLLPLCRGCLQRLQLGGLHVSTEQEEGGDRAARPRHRRQRPGVWLH